MPFFFFFKKTQKITKSESTRGRRRFFPARNGLKNAKHAKKGNSFGSDVRKGKKTIIAINALETSDKKNYLISILEKEDCSDDEVEKIVEIFEECGAVEYAKEIARDKVKSAKERIDEISGKLNPEYVDFFKEIADYIVERKI